MDKENDEEKHFTQNIDRMLAGEEIESVENMSEDYQTTVTFAQKLTELRAEPSPDFKGKLKQRLLSRLTEQELEAARQKEKGISFWEFLKNLVPRSPAWRTVTATVVVALVTVTVLWRTGMFTASPMLEEEGKVMISEREEAVVGKGALIEAAEEEETEAAVTAPPSLGIERAVQPLLKFEAVQLEPIVYPYGQIAEIDLVFRNTSTETITVEPFPPVIYIAGRRATTPVRLFTEGTGKIKLSSLGEQGYTLVWDQRDSKGEQVATGWYNVYAGDVAISKATEPRESHQSFQPINILIQYPQGAMEKTIELEQTQTVNGITITLERVELSTLEVSFYAFNLPPDYDLPQGRDLPPPRLMELHAHAEYRFDDSAAKDAGLSAIQFLDSGMTHTWNMLDPIPKDARELTFTITRLGDWFGPWAFTFSLED